MSEARTRLLRPALRLLRRDLQSGRLLIMLLAAIIAVASTVSVNLLVERVKRVMVAESAALLAGDLAVVTRDPVPARYANKARAAGLETARTVTLRSVIAVGEGLQLTRLKAVDTGYPLRGRLEIADAPAGAPRRAAGGPPRGEVWADLRLFRLLDLEPGAEISIGRETFVLSRVLVLEPDRGGDLFALAPRVMMHFDDLERTGLLLPGSRARWTLLVAGPPAALTAFRTGLELDDGHELRDPRGARPEVRSAFTQAERFLTLAAFAGVLLATIGIALAAGAYAGHHESTVAILKTLGLGRREVALLLTAEVIGLALLATVIGDALAIAVHHGLLARYLAEAAPATVGLPLTPLLYGGWVALVALAGFALPALLRLTALPVSAILNRDRFALGDGARAPLAAMLLAVLAIAPWYLGNAAVVAWALAGMAGCAVLLAVAARALVALLGRARVRTGMSWRFGLANIARRAHLSVTQCIALGLGIAVVLLLGLVRDDLIGAWQQRLPPRAPNQFLINIQPDEVAPLRAFLATRGRPGVDFYPMVRGRLSAINDAPVDPDAYADPRSRRLADREFNLSWATRPKADNRIVGGQWWAPHARGEMSMEQGIAERLGIGLGDRLDFTVADRTVSGRVTSLRAVEWDNFEVNFFLVTTPELLEAEPATWITSFYLDPARRGIMTELVQQFPSVTVIDVEALMQQVRGVMARVAGALTWVFGFAIAAGLLVLAAAAQATQRERALDVTLLKTLGASRRFITLTTVLEFAVLGALAGLLGSAGAVATGWLLAEFVLDVPYVPGWRVPLTGIAAGIAGVTLVGAGVVRRTHRRAIVASLRETA